MDVLIASDQQAAREIIRTGLKAARAHSQNWTTWRGIEQQM